MMRLVRRRLSPADKEGGVYAILYAVLVVVLIGMGALVVDNASVRQDRRLDRSAADSAVMAGAAKLGGGSASPYQACLTAWKYIARALNVSVPVSACSAFTSYQTQAQFNAYCASNGGAPAEIADERTLSNGRTVKIAWPIPHHPGGTISTFLTPDLAPGAASQTFITDVDGSDRGCERLGVALFEDERFGLGGALGASGTRTQVHSVARFDLYGGDDTVPVPLVVLDPHSCNALDVGGGGTSGGLVVRASLDGLFPGGIAVDSDADGTGEENCNGGKTPITVSNNSYIWALDTPDGVPGVIRSYAHTIGLPDARVWTGDTTGCTSPWLSTPPGSGPPNLCPLPNRLAFPRATSLPWVNRYNCDESASDCPQPQLTSPLPSPRNYVDQWVAYATGTTPPTYATTVLSGGSCTLAAGVYTDVYSDCTTLTISGTVRITGRLVALNNVSVTNSNCLLINDSDTTHCTTPPPAVATSSRGPDNGGLYIGGQLTIANSASVVTNQSFIYLAGRFDINTSGVFALTAPYGKALSTPGVCTPAADATQAPSAACFEAMALWSLYAGTSAGGSRNQLQGQTQLVVDGTVFTPNAYFFYAGGVSNDQLRAQFVTRRLKLQGSGRLTMTPDSSRGTNINGGGIRLIR